MRRHFFTVDVEEHFQVSAFDRVVSRESWQQQPSRLDVSIPRLLEALDRASATATFFVLGWVARHRPAIVRAIQRAGHEVASHGFGHERVCAMTPSSFRADIRASRAALEDVVGSPVRGYRAPSFSIVPGTEWAFDVLLEEGFAYDSSLFPINRRGYGYPGTPSMPHSIHRQAGTLLEFPLATARLAGLRVPAAGGGYLRHFPLWVIRQAFQQAECAGAPATFYLHPWEVDPDQPRLPVNALTRVRHYRGLTRTLRRVECLLSEFSFTSIASSLPALMRGEALEPARVGH